MALLYYLNDIPIEFWDFGLGVIIDALSLIGVGIVLPVFVKGVPHLWNASKKILIEKGASGYDDLSKFVGKKVEEVVRFCQKVSSNNLNWWEIGASASSSCDLIPEILADGSNLITQANKYLGKKIKAKDGLGNIAEIEIPANFTHSLADTQKGIVFKNPVNTENIRVMNPTTGTYARPNGYLKIQNEFGNYLDIYGKNLPTGIDTNTMRLMTHFDIIIQ